MEQIQLKNLYSALANTLLPKSHNIHKHIEDFLSEEVKNFEQTNKQNDVVLDQLKEEWEEYNRFMTELKFKKNKDTRFIQGSVGYIKTKEDQIHAKKKVIQSINTGMRESVTKINPKKLAHLPYEKHPVLKQLFRTLFVVLYNQPANKYDWEVFKKLALKHNQGEDFLTRMANIDFKVLPQSYYHQLLKLKVDQQFKQVCENSNFAYDIVDVADWVDYVCQGQKINAEKKQCEHDLNKIRFDKTRREDKSVQLKQEFCIQTLKDIDSYQSNIISLQAQLRTLALNMNSSVKQIKQIEQRREKQVAKINSI